MDIYIRICNVKHISSRYTVDYLNILENLLLKKFKARIQIFLKKRII